MKKISIVCIMLAALQSFSQNLPEKISFSAGRSIVADSKDNIFIGLFNKLVKITPAGKATEFITGKYFDYMTIDANDNIYAIGSRDNIIRKITPDGKISKMGGLDYKYTVIDGPLATANFRSLDFIAIDKKGNLFVLDADDPKPNIQFPNNVSYKTFLIRKISKEGIVSTVKDAVSKEKIWVERPEGLGIDSLGNLYVSYSDQRCIKKIALSPTGDGTISTVAGMCGKREFHPVYTPGDISKAELFTPADIVFNTKGELIYADIRLHRIIKIADKKVITIAGNSEIQPNNVNMAGRAQEGYKDGPALKALFNFPLGVSLTYDSKGNLFIVDGGNDCIRKLSTDGMVTTFIK